MWRGDEEISQLFDELHRLREELRRWKLDMRSGIDLRAVAEKASCPICVTNLAGRLLYANPFFAARHGCEREDCIGRALSSFLAADSQQEWNRLRALVAEGQTVAADTLVHAARGGRAFATASVLYPLPDSVGAPAFIVLLSMEMREPPRRGRPRPAVQADAKNRRFFEEAPLPYVVLDRRGRIRDINRQWRESFGHSLRAIRGVPFARLLDQESRIRFERDFPLLGHSDARSESAFHLSTPFGRPVMIIFRARARQDAAGNPREILLLAWDVTAHVSAMEQFRRTDLLLRQAEIQGGLGSWELDLQTGLLLWSDEMYRLLGRDKSLGPPGLHDALGLFGFDEKDLEEIVRRARTSGEKIEREFSQAAADGERRWFHGIINASLDSAGRPSRLFGSLQDITERRTFEKRLRERDARMLRQNQELAEKNLKLTELLARLQEAEQATDTRVRAVINWSLIPLLHQLKKHAKGDRQDFDLLEEALKTFSFQSGQQPHSSLAMLTRRELEICHMIRSGLSSKEIAARLSITSQSVQTHRNHIRRKLGLLNKGLNLGGYLQTFENGTKARDT